MGADRSTDAQIAALAGAQGGYVHRDQLVRLSLTAKAIRHRVSRGFLIPVYYRVYAVGHIPTSPIDRAKGALLAAGPRSALADVSAGSYYGIHKHWSHPLHVTVLTDRRIKGLVIHRNRRLTRSDIITLEPNLRVVSPVIALLENALYLTQRRLTRVVNEIRLQYRISLPQIEATARRFPRHPGVTALGPIMATSQPEPNRSAWEDEWPAFAAAHGLPDFVMNQDVAGHRVDVLFPDERVIIELDGWTTHQTRQAFIRDRNQDAEILARTGIPTLRITHEDFHRHPAREAARLRAILRHRQELGGAG